MEEKGNEGMKENMNENVNQSMEANRNQSMSENTDQNVQQNENEKASNQQGGYYSGNSGYSYAVNSEKMKMQKAQDEKEFDIFGIISLIYAAMFVFCLYKNFSGVTSVLFSAATVYYMVYVSKKMGRTWKLINTFISGAIVLLGISNFTTGNAVIIFFNYAAMICLIATNMMYLFCNTKELNVTKHLSLLLASIFGSIGEFDAPFRQLKVALKKFQRKKHGNTVYVFIGVAIAIPVLLVIGSILASADEVFREVFREIGAFFSIDKIFGNLFGIAIMFVIGYVVPYAFSKYISGKRIYIKEGKSGTNEPIVAIIVTGAVSLLYVLFSGIQIVYLFLGNGTLPSDYSYAEYAREGFFQLLFVSAFNVVLVLVCIEFFRESKILKGILAVISVCTFVMIASSAYRMSMYIGEYGLTFTRVFVIWSLAVITFVMAGLLYQLFQAEFNLFQYSLIVTTVCFVILSFSHIDYFIAKYDLDMYEQMREEQKDGDEWYEYVDYYYLMGLSTDAAPAIMNHSNEIYEYISKEYYDDVNTVIREDVSWSYQYYEEDGTEFNKITIRNFNVSKYIASEIVK